MQDKIYDRDIIDAGKSLINNFYRLCKTALIHDFNNTAIMNLLSSTLDNINHLFTTYERSFSIRLVHEHIFIDDIKIKIDIENFLASLFLMEEMKKRDIGIIEFSYPLSEEEVKQFIKAFITPVSETPSRDPFEMFNDLLVSSHIQNIHVEPYREGLNEFDNLLENTKEMSKFIYFRTLSIASEIMESIKLKNSVSMRRAKRLVQSMVDLMLQEESTLLGLTTLRSYDEYTYNHSVNVAILSIGIGQRLGYRRKELGELGMATLFHDIGKIDLPKDLLNKPSEFTPQEWEIMRRHPVYGVKTLLRLKGLQEQAIKMIMASFEHHLNYDLSGYPKLSSPKRVSLFGRIASIADCYDALTSARVYNRTPLVPDKALAYMMKKSGLAFDPILLKIFVNVVGIYPVGTIVLLNTHQLAVITRANPNPANIHRPHIKLITDPGGNEIDGDIIDLSHTPSLFIIKSLDHRKYGIDVSRYFM